MVAIVELYLCHWRWRKISLWLSFHAFRLGLLFTSEHCALPSSRITAIVVHHNPSLVHFGSFCWYGSTYTLMMTGWSRLKVCLSRHFKCDADAEIIEKAILKQQTIHDKLFVASKTMLYKRLWPWYKTVQRRYLGKIVLYAENIINVRVSVEATKRVFFCHRKCTLLCDGKIGRQLASSYCMHGTWMLSKTLNTLAYTHSLLYLTWRRKRF